jgi:peptide-methionine (S)-S-oxide reductase
MSIPSKRSPAFRKIVIALGACAAFSAVMLLGQGPAAAAEDAVVIAAPAVDEPASTAPTETAVFAGGCFWGVQGVFQHVRGVTQALSGYAGGKASTAQYDTVSDGNTGHAESVQVTYDPRQVTYGKLLQIYFSVAHDPTQLNRQGPDSGTQYRSTIFVSNDMQRKVAQAYIAQLDKAKSYPKPIVTTLENLQGFYPAEAYHQNFLVNNPRYPYIVYNDLPKVANLSRIFADTYVDKPVLVAQK